MKKLLLSIIIIASGVSLVKAQSALPYKSLEDFATDTTAFIKYNFVDRKDHYEGKNLEYLLNDLQITPVLSGMGFTLEEEKEISFTSLRLYLNKDGVNSLYIQIHWENPPILNSYMKKLFKKYGVNKWVPRYRQTFGEYLIKNITTSLNSN